jgi:hypothetical protein
VHVLPVSSLRGTLTRDMPADRIPTRKCAYLVPRYPEKKAWSKKLHCHLFNGNRQLIFKEQAENKRLKGRKCGFRVDITMA